MAAAAVLPALGLVVLGVFVAHAGHIKKSKKLESKKSKKNPKSRSPKNKKKNPKNPESKIQNPEIRIRNPKSKIQIQKIQKTLKKVCKIEGTDIVFCKRIGIKNPKSRSPKNKKKNPKNPKSRVQNRKIQIQNAKSGIQIQKIQETLKKVCKIEGTDIVFCKRIGIRNLPVKPGIQSTKLIQLKTNPHMEQHPFRNPSRQCRTV
jgi:flagellar biosynthesis component FlhA